MEIEKAFLPLIFEQDLLYLSDDDITQTVTSTASIEPVALKQANQPADKAQQVQEEETAYQKAAIKPVLVLVDDQFEAAEQNLLQNILKALQTEVADVEIVKEHPAAFKPDSGIKLFLSFDDALVKNPQYEMNKIHQTAIIYAHSLSTLEGEKTLKMQLWKLLKEMG